MTTFVTVEKGRGKTSEYHRQTATSLGYVEGEDGVWRREPRRPAGWGPMSRPHEYNPAGVTPITGEQEEDPDATAEGTTQEED